jgi:hypothetical protein
MSKDWAMMERLSNEQLSFINESRGSCPDCKVGGLISGPRGGCAQNFRCNHCGHEFNLSLTTGLIGPLMEGIDFAPSVWYGERLDRDDSSIYNSESPTLAHLFAIEEDATLTQVAQHIVDMNLI